MLNPRSPVPLYRQLADHLQAQVRDGAYPAGTRIPSEHELAAAFGIGRPTVRQATEILVRGRILERRRGAGTFVREPEPEVDLFSLAGTVAAFEKEGLPVATELLRAPALRPVSGPLENPFRGQHAYAFSRRTRADGEPVLIEEFSLDPKLFRDLDRLDLRGRSLRRVARDHYFLIPEGARQTFRVDAADRIRARNLEVPERTPILTVHRYLHFPRAESAIYARLSCRTERFAFSQILTGFDHA